MVSKLRLHWHLVKIRSNNERWWKTHSTWLCICICVFVWQKTHLTGCVFMLMTRLCKGFANSAASFGFSSNGCFLAKYKVIVIDLDACPTWCNRGRGPLAHGCWSPTHSGGSQQRQPSLPPSWSFSWNRVETKAETFLQSSHNILICDRWNLLTEFSWYVLAPASRSSLHTSDFPGYTELNRI